MDRHQHMRKWTFGRIARLLLRAVFLVGLVFLALSPFSLKNLWLPLAARSFGCTLSAESAAFHPLRPGPNLTIRGLSLQDSDGNEVHIDSFEGRLRLLSLLGGTLDADAMRLNGVRLTLSRTADFTGSDLALGSRNLKIGAADLSDVRISVPLPDGSTCEIRSAAISLSGLIPETDNMLKGSFRVYPAGMGRDAPGIDLRTEMRFSLDRTFRTASLLGSLVLSNGSGLWHDRALSGADGVLLLQAETKSPGGPLTWKANLDCSGIDCADLIHAEGKGSVDHSRESGTMTWTMSARLSDARFQETYLPDSPGVRVFPENLRLKSGEIRLEWDPETIRWITEGEITLDKLWMGKNEPVSGGSFRFRKNISYSRTSKELSLQELTGDLQIGDSAVSCRNEGVFIFSRDKSGYHVRANNSSLLLNVRSLPAGFFNPFLPVNVSGGTLSLDYRLTADSGRQELTGGMTSFLKDVKLSADNGEEIVRDHDMTAKFSFHSQGLDNIRGLIVDDCTLEITGEQPDRKILRADLSGRWSLHDGGLALSGRMDLNPSEAADRFVRYPAKDLGEILRRHHAEDTWYHGSLSVDFDPANSSSLSFGIQTSFDTLAFLESGVQTPLVLDIEGTVAREQGGFGSGVNFHTIRLNAAELAEASARGHLSLTDGQSEFHVTVERISPVIPRGLMRFFFRHDLTEEQISLFTFKSLSGEASFRFDPADRSLRVFPFRAVMIPSDDGRSAVTLSLDRDYLCFLSEPEKSEAALSLVVENLPVKWFDFLIPTDASFRFLSGLIQGSAEVTVRNNGADIFLDHDAIAEDYSFAVKDAVWEVGDCRTSGKTCFRDYFSTYDLGNVQFRCLEGTHEYLFLAVGGSLALTPEGLTFFDFDISKTSELLPLKLFGDISEHLTVRTFDAAGKARFDGNEDYSRNTFSCRMDIRSLEWTPDEKKKFTPGPLGGNVKIDLATEPFLIRFKDSGIRLADRNGHRILHLSADGVLSSDPEKTGPARCLIRSDGIDGEFLYRVFSRDTRTAASRPPDPVPPAAAPRMSGTEKRPGTPPPPSVAGIQTKTQVPSEVVSVTSEAAPPGDAAPVLPRGDGSSAVWPFRGEPPGFRIYGYRTELTADLRGLTFTRHVNAALSGKFSASDETLEAKNVLLQINDSVAMCSGRVRTAGKDGFEYKGRLYLSGLDVSGLILAGAELKGKEFPMSDLRGVIRDLNLEVQGQGLSLRNLDRFLKVRLKADMENLSIPYEAGTAMLLLRLLLLPVQQVPKLVRLLPPSMARRLLQQVIGEGADVPAGGYRNAEFTKGVLELESSGTDFLVKRMYFTGPQIKTRMVRGGFNPFYNVIRADLLTRLSGINFPIRLTGTLENPEIDKSYFLVEFFRKNTFAAGENTLNILSLGLKGKDDEARWTAPAEPMTSDAPEGGVRPGGQAPGSR